MLQGDDNGAAEFLMGKHRFQEVKVIQTATSHSRL